MRIPIGKDDPMMLLVAVQLGQWFPQHKPDLLQIAHQARDGIELEVLPLKKGRSRQAESYYRKWCRQFAQYCGLREDEMHEELLMLTFGERIESTRFGPKRRPLRRSADVTQEEYSALIDTLVETAGNFGFAVPPAVPGRGDGS